MLWTLFKIQPLRIGLLLLLSIIRGLVPAAEIYALAKISYSIVVQHDLDLSSPAAGWLLVLSLCRIGNEVVGFGSRRLSIEIRRRIEKTLRKDIIDKILTTDLRQRERRQFSDIIIRAQSAIDPQRLIYLLERLPQSFSRVLTTVSVCVMLYCVNWILPLLNLSCLVACSSVQLRLSKLYFDSLRRTSKEERVLGTYRSALMTKNTVAELRVFGRYDWLLRKWRDFDIAFKRKRRAKYSVREIAAKLIVFLMQYGLPSLSIIIVMVSKNGGSVENTITAVQSSVALSSNIYALLYEFASFADSIELYSDYFAFFEKRKQISCDEPMECSAIGVECNNVTFSYDDKADPAVRNLTVKIHPNERVVLVGENGSGKTTFVKLILGLYKPSSGTVNIINPDQSTGERMKMSAVFQDFAKYMLTLRHNVGYGEVSLFHNSREICDTLSRVNLPISDIELDKQLGLQFGGREFSQGQWQKIAVARGCIRKNYGLVVMDEPTASLDPFAEAEILRSFFKLCGNATCVFVSHRLSSVRLADRILVMKEGQIVEEGTHSELMSRRGEYYKMFSQQAQLYA